MNYVRLSPLVRFSPDGAQPFFDSSMLAAIISVPFFPTLVQEEDTIISGHIFMSYGSRHYHFACNCLYPTNYYDNCNNNPSYRNDYGYYSTTTTTTTTVRTTGAPLLIVKILVLLATTSHQEIQEAYKRPPRNRVCLHRIV